MKYFLEISVDSNNLYYITEKNWYDWNKQCNWSNIGLKVGSKYEIFCELKSYLRFKKVEYVFGEEHIIEYLRQEKLKELGI